MQKLIKRLLLFQRGRGDISQEDMELYQYGYTLALNAMINLLIVLIIGIGFREISFVLLFHFFFIPLRIYCGGWHAGNTLKCTFFSGILIVIDTSLYHFLPANVDSIFLILIDTAFIAVIASSRSNAGKWKRISEKEISRYTAIVRIQLVLHAAIVLIGLWAGQEWLLKLFVTVHGSMAILVVLEKIKV